MKTPSFLATAALLLTLAISPASATGDAPALSALAKMPVREVTIFKDGNALVLHQGAMPTDASGNILMDRLPSPVFGTFWPFVSTKDVKLTAVTAGQRRVSVERTPLSIQELIEANPGAQVTITETPASTTQTPVSYQASIIGVTGRSSAELEAAAPPDTGDLLPEKGSVVLLRTSDGTKAVKLERIQDVTFKDVPKNALGNIEFRNLLTAHLDWAGRKPDPTVEAGLMYLQHGIRWIPEYKVTVDGQGKATVKLQATLINELMDMDDVTCHLVVGVPTFQFKDMVDPMALQQGMVRLSQYFQRQGGSNMNMLSNSMMTQVADAKKDESQQDADLGPEVDAGSVQTEDLHIFTVKHVSLKKGERMVVPIAEYTVPYHDIFALDIPCAPPKEIWQDLDHGRRADLARSLATKVMHKIRLENKSEDPFTTAPALIMSGNQVLAQRLMTYTPKGGSMDLPVTNAVDIQVKKSETETQRTPNATTWNGKSYTRVDLAGTITLVNYRTQPAELDLVRHVLGNITDAGQDGKADKLNVLEDSGDDTGEGDAHPYWWGWHDWPTGWSNVNGIGSITWKQTLDPGKSIDLKYAWNYYWR